MWKKRLTLTAVLFLLLTSFVEVASPAWVEVSGDSGKVNVVINYWPGLDKYGKPSVNPDGTFYPNDQLWVRYCVYVAEGLKFDGIQATYDQSAFEKLQDVGWGSTSGTALFKVKADANPGFYDFKVEAEASTTAETGTSGSVSVTFGGVDVYAYYRAEYLLTILPSDHGTTSPTPGSYWYAKGEPVLVFAIPDNYYQLDYWLIDDRYAGSSNPIRVVMDAPHKLQPFFRKAKFDLSISATAGGTTDPPPGTYLYDGGSYVSVSAIPEANYVFSRWVLDGRDAGSSNPISIFIDSPHSLMAVFQKAENTTVSQSIGAKFLAAASTTSSATQAAELKLVIKDLKWTTWFDLFRGIVCRASGYLYDSSGKPVVYSDVVAEFRKRNFWTGNAWVVSKTVKTNNRGYFAVEEACNPFFEQFTGVQAWAEKAGYAPSWSLFAYLDPSSASVGKGGGFLAGVRVYLNGRYTTVPVSLSIKGVPSDCAASFNPQSGEVDGLTSFQSILALNVAQTTPLGRYMLQVEASSGKVSYQASFALEITEPIQIPSSVRFTTYGLDADAEGVVLTLDSSRSVYANQLPYVADWKTNTRHSFMWTAVLGSRVNGKRYVFEKAVVVTRYVSTATVRVEVVNYDPQFTAFVYTMPKSPGENSYEKYFAIIVRYDGNGPEKKLGQRAVFDGWSWYGYASRISAQQQLTGLTGIPGFSEMKPEDIVKNMQALMWLFNLTGGVTFSAAGMDAKTDGVILKVDGESLTADQLPKTYRWPEGTTHSYEWATQMPVYEWVESPRWGTGRYEKVGDEWFGFEYAIVALPQLTEKNITLEEVQRLGREFASKLRSPRGSINATELGNRVVGVYSRNRLLTNIAEEAGVSRDALKLVNIQLPVFFNNESRYAKFVFDLDDRVAAEAVKQLYNTSLTYRISFTSSAFSAQIRSFDVNFTCPLEYYKKAVNATAFKWDSVAKKWAVDHTVRIEVVLSTTFNTTEADWFRDSLKEQMVDEVMLKMACEDIYECYPQYFGGQGSASGVMDRTSAFYYNLNATAGRGNYAAGSLPSKTDAWTESVKAPDAWWTSFTSKVSADASRKVKGSASIRAWEDEAANASAVLNLLKPIRSRPSSRLIFEIFLDDSCSGKVTVYLEGQYAASTFSTMASTGRWVDIVIGQVPSDTKRVGVYVELQEERGGFWIDDLAFTDVDVWGWTKSVTLEKTVYINFASNKPFTVYVNLDPNSPLPVNVTLDDVKTSWLTVYAAPELGGLANLTVYAVIDAPAGYSLDKIPIERLRLKKLFTVNLTAPEERIEELKFSSYTGYSAIHGGVLGFAGQTELIVVKDPEVKTLQGYDKALLLIEAENVWGTKFHAIAAVQPWGKTFWEILFEQIAMVLIGVAIAAVIVGLVVKFIRESRGQL